MKRIVITFDDGRKDNVEFALPVLQHYKFKASFFITTGYIDESFLPKTWASSQAHMSIDDILFLYKNGFEIGLHGDKHCSEIDDFNISYEKMNKWLNKNNTKYSFSIPNSKIEINFLNEFTKSIKNKTKYIRGGSHCNFAKTITWKIKKALRIYFNCSYFFIKYHLDDSFTDIPKIVPSVGIRNNDRVVKLCKLINKISDNSTIVFMFHSIVPNNSEYINRDKWVWSLEKFDEFCRFLSQKEKNKELIVLPLREI